jgi:uncharacterized RDD family membrane protein YckC
VAAAIDTLAAVVVTAIAIGIAIAAGLDDATVQSVVLGAMAGMVAIYLILPTALTGQSVGKRLTHIMLVDRQTGHLPAPTKVVYHYLPMFLVLVLFGGAPGAPAALMAGFSFYMTRDGTSIGDKLAKTAVVIARYRPERVR